MPVSLDDLKANIWEYIETGEDAFKKGRYNSASILYFKALVGICDYIIKRDLNLEPKDEVGALRNEVLKLTDRIK